MQSKGIDNVTIKSFKNNLDNNLEEISKEIRAGEFKFNKLRARPIKKAGCSKPRPRQRSCCDEGTCTAYRPDFSKVRPRMQLRIHQRTWSEQSGDENSRTCAAGPQVLLRSRHHKLLWSSG
jgi:hypothetical protein